jgi:hypothetical protein
MSRKKKGKYPCPRCGQPMHLNGRSDSGKTPRWICITGTGGSKKHGETREYCYSTTNPTAPAPRTHRGHGNVMEGPPEEFKRELRPVKTFIITAAQNNTEVHTPFWDSLRRAARHFDAEILVIPLRYRNPTAPKETDDEGKPIGDYWAKAVRPYLWSVRAKLNKNLSVLGDIKIQPTAVEPLTGLEGFTGSESTIVGHTKLALRMVATPGHKTAKLMTTTGACTRKNYSDTRAGKHGEFHHALAACLVEIEGPYFWLRQLNANSRGEFTDLGTRFTPKGIKKAPRPAAVSLGDTHVDFTDKSVERATFGVGSLVATLRPKAIFYHDLLDSYSCNPHHRGNPFNAIAKLKSGMNDIEAEVMRAIDYARRMTPSWAQGYIVRSNHDDMLTRAIIANDWKSDPANAEFYLRTALAMVRSVKMGDGGTEYDDAFAYWVGQAGLKNVRVVGAREQIVLAGILLTLHGDEGPNGARGSLRNLKRIGAKVVIGHSHTPGISEGGMQTGTSSVLDPEYVGPVSSWAHAHVITHEDGKRQLVFIIDGRYRR